MNNKKWMHAFCFSFLMFFLNTSAFAQLSYELERLHEAYPDYIRAVNEKYIVWKDGSQIHIHDANASRSNDMADDWGRVRYESLFRKMYGNSPKEVEQKLVIIYWMPKIFGTKYPLPVTSVNGVDKQLQKVSAELEKLPASYHKYLKSPEGTYSWRNIAHTNRLSTHSFGTTIDLNRRYGDYWQWDLKKSGRPIRESARLPYRNRIPDKIVNIFEKHGFIWGGDWYHYDTMHFEYRPELA